MKDRNFDDLFERFSKNIYQSLKGQIRLAVVGQDLMDAIPELYQQQGLRVLDAGGGLGAFSAQFAQQGHDIVYCDISEKMLAAAREAAQQQGIDHSIEFRHESLQTSLANDRQYDVILMHAVLEWLADPSRVLEQVLEAMQPGTKLSLLFYNQQSIVFRNLLRGNFRKAMSDSHQGDQGSLTPINPLNPDDVKAWVRDHNVNILLESGVRNFYDYGEKSRLSQRTAEQIIETEIAFARQMPYRALGRYYHLIIEK